MKSVLTAILAFAALVAFSGPTVAQQQSTQKTKQPEPTKQPVSLEATTVKGSKSNSDNRSTQDKASPLVMTGKVTAVDPKAKTFTVTAKGKQFTFSAAELKGPLPEVGKILDITYTQATPGGTLKSIALNSSRSNIY
jgi:hypothetical protein